MRSSLALVSGLLQLSFVLAQRDFSYAKSEQAPLSTDASTSFFSSEYTEGFTLDLDDRRLIQMSPEAEPMWVTERDKISFKAAGINFMDITDAQDLGLTALHTVRSDRFVMTNNSKAIKKVIQTLSTDGPESNLRKLTSFRTRYYRSSTGKESQQWLLSRVAEITDSEASDSLRSSISISEFPHSWGQNTIVAHINGTSNAEEIVVLGAHQDSTNLLPFLAAPGADDDGSGSVTILETYRALISSGLAPNRSVEFHWYSAEEGGLLGSQALARSYASEGKSIFAMMQMDMTAWVKKGTREEAGVITDFTDPKLTEFNKGLIEEYLDIPYVETKCGYACSDHASWQKAGYPAAFVIESAFENSNRNIHSSNDRIDISPEFSFKHMLEFSKLAVAFAMELAEWN